MIELRESPRLRDPVVIAAFEGWNDAAGAATGLVDHLVEQWQARTVAAIDPEDYYDFQMNRPSIGIDERGFRKLTWPSTHVSVASPPQWDRDVIFVRGIEPNMRWRTFVSELLGVCDELAGTAVISLGALLADTPHTRPVPVTGSASEPEWEDKLNLEPATYEGPTGIIGVLQDACIRLDIASVSLWAAVPHYVAQPPCPKASLALLSGLEDVLGCSLPVGDLAEDAQAWQRGINELSEEDEDVAEYVEALEEALDTAELPEASGDAIAKEFERYLKRRGGNS